MLAKKSLISVNKVPSSLLVISFSLFTSHACEERPKRQDRNLLSCSVTSPMLLVLPTATLRESMEDI